MDDSGIEKHFLRVENLLLEEHNKHFFPFTRLLIALSVAFITLLASSGNLFHLNESPFVLLKATLVLQLISLFSGVIVQYEAVENPLRHLRRYTQTRAANPGALIILDRPHSTLMLICYRLQLAFFVLAFFLVSAHFIVL